MLLSRTGIKTAPLAVVRRSLHILLPGTFATCPTRSILPAKTMHHRHLRVPLLKRRSRRGECALAINADAGKVRLASRYGMGDILINWLDLVKCRSRPSFSKRMAANSKFLQVTVAKSKGADVQTVFPSSTNAHILPGQT